MLLTTINELSKVDEFSEYLQEVNYIISVLYSNPDYYYSNDFYSLRWAICNKLFNITDCKTNILVDFPMDCIEIDPNYITIQFPACAGFKCIVVFEHSIMHTHEAYNANVLHFQCLKILKDD